MTAIEPQTSTSVPSRLRRLAAVMFADMVGYSSRMEQDEERNTHQAARSVELFRSLIGDYGGEVANVAGDGILALFDSAERAVRFALQMQREFSEEAVWSDGAPIRFRVALHLGSVSVAGGNVLGHCVNVAARIQTLAEPGSVLVTGAIRNAIGDVSNLTLRALGPQSLRNIAEPVEVFAVAAAEVPASTVPPRGEATPEISRQPSIAVLAFSNLSGDLANDHLCEGIAEDVIADLSRFRSLMVIARHSSFLFSLKAHSTRDIGRRLGARYLLAGRLRRAGRRVRIAVELIDVESESVVWSDRFAIEIEELFDLQDEIAGAVASRLAVQIDLAERRHEAQHPRDMRAYGLVLRARHLTLLHTREATAHARRLCEEAIDVAPEYGRAHSIISRTHNLDWRYAWSPSPDWSLDAAVELARRAIQLDRLDAHGFAELGFASLYKKRHDEALAEYARALALNPNDADIIAEYADALCYAGQPRRSLELLEKAMRLNPYYPDSYLWCLADAHNAMGQPTEVVATVRRMQNPAEGRRLLAANLAHLGRLSEAQAEAAEVMRLHPGFTISQWRNRPPYRDEAVLGRYIEGLRKAGLPD